MFRHDPGSNSHKITTTLLVVSIDLAGIVDDIVAAGGGVNGEIIVVVAVIVVGVVPSEVGILPHFCYCLCISLRMCLIKLTVMMISNQKS